MCLCQCCLFLVDLSHLEHMTLFF
uniref:Uncharacterized protein n=1 Tax=Rhizophora mucronata TaxID=61149 RepID=A0A2P2PN19_RHIMU